MSNGATVNSSSVPYDVTFKYMNSDIIAKQIGVSFDITAVLTKKLYCKLYGTLQETKLENFNPLSLNQNIGAMSANAASVNTPSVMAVDNYLAPGTRTIGLNFGGSSYKPDTSVNTTHKATPSFFGGFSLNYTPVKKINCNVNLYYYSKQTLIHSFESKEVDAKMIMNLKISYKLWKESSIYFNARNLLNNKKKEFAFVDDIKGTYLIGVDFRF
jgi:iron complex outermembrane receptor protein